jgi:hypothetical protein
MDTDEEERENGKSLEDEEAGDGMRWSTVDPYAA